MSKLTIEIEVQIKTDSLTKACRFDLVSQSLYLFRMLVCLPVCKTQLKRIFMKFSGDSIFTCSSSLVGKGFGVSTSSNSF